MGVVSEERLKQIGAEFESIESFGDRQRYMENLSPEERTAFVIDKTEAAIKYADFMRATAQAMGVPKNEFLIALGYLVEMEEIKLPGIKQHLSSYCGPIARAIYEAKKNTEQKKGPQDEKNSTNEGTDASPLNRGAGQGHSGEGDRTVYGNLGIHREEGMGSFADCTHDSDATGQPRTKLPH